MKTTIWDELGRKSSPEADDVRATLQKCMPNIDRILSSGGSSPLNFTLHDSGHAFRVAQRMAEIIPSDVFPKLSTYELALLLLSAYLHDIGMTPEVRRVQALYTLLLTNDAQDLPETEQTEFRKWLDENRAGTSPPLASDTANSETYKLANEIIAYYSRSRHVDWGEEWIRLNLASLTLGTYVGWVADLVLLCRSHHEYYNELKKESFNPRPVGSPSVMVHLRYLAVVLRVADVLELDPERTSAVILRHRDIPTSSLIYWWKDQELSVRLEGSRVVVWARPRSAQIHKAVDITIHDIDVELSLSRRLADETHFETCPGLTAALPHRWDLSPASHSDIRPREDSYVYIDGSFRPDTQKLLQLLSGVELYGSKLVAVREVLQNAFDAVREKIAYERLSRTNATNPSLGMALAELNRVDLRVDVSADGAWLTSVDTGVGMTKAMIQDHLLVSGVSSRHDVLDLERKCRQAGFTLGRTGQFGIGVLSYFMLADRVIIKTRRSQEPGDGDGEGWVFETEGVGSFGELRRDPNIAPGTEVRLHLRPEVVGGSLSEWYSELRKYLRYELVRIPCAFTLKSALPGGETLDLKAGFAYSQAQFTSLVAGELKSALKVSDTPVDLLPLKKKKALQAEQRDLVDVDEELRRFLRWEVREGELPEQLGTCRIRLPYFQLSGGCSLVFLRAKSKEGKQELRKVGKGYCYIPRSQSIYSWKGMRLAGDPRFVKSGFYRYERGWITQARAIVEVDWASSDAGRIGVNRYDVEFKKGSGAPALARPAMPRRQPKLSERKSWLSI